MQSSSGAGAGNDSVAVITTILIFNYSAIYTKIELIVICNSFPNIVQTAQIPYTVISFVHLCVCVNEATEANIRIEKD